ncbi:MULTISPECIES: RHS repeat-associated core domain-containing protein [unclassified Microbulbifer]|uniref:RHS repeat-associated core domain-containing protein n=1 Tax=unclassified Microbulbifer TaxID=2619833 RepID=UPI0027E42312|nr:MULTISPECIES: RHS repeat-associated core domain-containing protein [unclassified Microbulbifer]
MHFTKSVLAGALSLLVAHGTSAAVTEQNWSYTYTTAGKLETANGPRTDVPDITTYGYDANNRLASTTNALDHVESILVYDAGGRPLKVQDANGLQTHYTYTVRGWLETVTVKAAAGDLVTTYTYDPVGQVTNIAYPDSSSVTFEYDAARRLTAVENTLGERVEYVLDPAGNVKEEKVFAADGTTLVRSVSRNYDELSRLIDVNGNNGQNTSIAYNKNGERVSTTDGNQNTTGETRDALGRVKTVTDADTNQIQYAYDSADRIKSVTDQRGNTTRYEYDFAGNLTKLTSPDTGVTDYDYDEAGNLKVRTDARSVVTNYSYDALNRLTAITYPGSTSENAVFTYDSTLNGNKGTGRLTGYSNDSGSTAITYDDLGRITQQDDTIASWSFSTQYSYDSMGRIASITYPSGRIVTYSRDSLGRISAITSKDDAHATAQTIVSNIQYQPYGGIASMDYGNGITQSYTYDLDGRLETVTATGIGNIRSDYYTYDLANNITGIADNLDANKDKAFIYDNLNRLTDEGYVEGQKNYQYDPVGNRTQKTWTKTDQSQEANAYSYETTSNRLIQKDAKAWVTDAVGNTISTDDGAKTYTYNHANRLKTYTENTQLKGTYYYNALGQRVRTDKAEDNLLHYDLSGQYLGETNIAANGIDIQSQIDYIYLDNMPVAQVVTQYSEGQVQSRTLTYLHADHLNTPRIGTDNNEKIVWRWDSDAFGQTEPNTNPDNDANQTIVNLRFPGQIKGSEAPHYYNYFRDYDPSTGRYLQSDPIGLNGGINTYGYVGGNPVNAIDPNGLDCIAINGSVTCTVPDGGPTITFPRPGDWPDTLNSNSSNYHYYNIPVPLNGADAACVKQGIANNPTPGSPSPATPNGTSNNATPTGAQNFFNTIDYVSSFGNDPGGYNNSPVNSYLLNNGSVVVNVTLPGHPLHPGYVARTVSNGQVNNQGEGIGFLQSQYSPVAEQINGVWNGQTAGIVNNCSCQ